jgi:steroid delta-isomerase-like uncharacterized protein
MSTDSEKIVRRWFTEVWNERSPDAVRELFASDAVAYGLAEGGGEDPRGPEAFQEFRGNMLREFPDFHIDIEDVIADGEKVAVRWIAQGTYQGSMLAPQINGGRRVRMSGMTIARIVDGKILEGWNNWDIMGMMRQLGAPPAMANLIP